MPDSSQRHVALLRCATYDRPVLRERLNTVLSSLSFSVPRGSSVLLKPNLVTGRNPSSPACTNGFFIAAIAEWFLDHGAQVAVGDSPAFGSGRQVMEACGITTALQRLPVTLLDFSHKEEITLRCGIKTTLAAEIFAYDYLINLPKLKAHSQMLLSCAVKNLFGSVLGYRKAMAHMRHGDHESRFAAMIVDLSALLPQGISILDGVIAMHREGPIYGEPHPTGIIGASRDPVALDTAILQLLGVQAEASPLWRECQRRGLPGAEFRNLHYPLLTPEELAISTFFLPATLTPVRFRLRSFLKNGAIKIINLCKK